MRSQASELSESLARLAIHADPAWCVVGFTALRSLLTLVSPRLSLRLVISLQQKGMLVDMMTALQRQLSTASTVASQVVAKSVTSTGVVGSTSDSNENMELLHATLQFFCTVVESNNGAVEAVEAVVQTGIVALITNIVAFRRAPISIAGSTTQQDKNAGIAYKKGFSASLQCLSLLLSQGSGRLDLMQEMAVFLRRNQSTLSYFLRAQDCSIAGLRVTEQISCCLYLLAQKTMALPKAGDPRSTNNGLLRLRQFLEDDTDALLLDSLATLEAFSKCFFFLPMTMTFFCCYTVALVCLLLLFDVVCCCSL
jgi:hypothetical protein